MPPTLLESMGLLCSRQKPLNEAHGAENAQVNFPLNVLHRVP